MASIFDEKCKERKLQGRTNSRMSIFNHTLQLVVANLFTKFGVFILNGCGDIFDEKSGDKKKKYREEQIGEGPFSIPQYNMSL